MLPRQFVNQEVKILAVNANIPNKNLCSVYYVLKKKQIFVFRKRIKMHEVKGLFLNKFIDV